MTNNTTNNTALKQAEFTKLLPDFKRFAATKRGGLYMEEIRREMLRCVHGDKDYLHATDSHRAIRIKREYVSGEPEGEFNYDVRTGEYVDVNYPENINRLYPEDWNEEYFIPYGQLKDVRDALQAVYKDARERKVRNNEVLIEIEGGNITFKARGEGNNDYGEVRTVENAVDFRCDDAVFHMNAKYLLDALITVSKLRRYGESDGLYLRFVSKLRPIVITDGSMYEMVVMPVRTY